MLDDRLHSTVDSITSLDSYVDPDRRWSLIKLHGSVNWGRKVRDSAVNISHLQNPDPDLPIDDEITWLGGFGANLPELRHGPDGSTYYPAVAVPVGEEDELVCPDAHIEFLRAKLREAERVHLLVIGYSGYDQEVIRVLQETQATIGSLFVVNAGAEQAQAVAARLGPAFGLGLPMGSWSDVAFREFVQSAQLDRYLERLSEI